VCLKTLRLVYQLLGSDLDSVCLRLFGFWHEDAEDALVEFGVDLILLNRTRNTDRATELARAPPDAVEGLPQNTGKPPQCRNRTVGVAIAS
jgi:hypothetical protein